MSQAREPILLRARFSPQGQAAGIARADRAARARIVAELQRTHGNTYVQRVMAEARTIKKPAAVRVQRCGGKPCNCSAEEQQAHATEMMTESVQRLEALDVAGEIRRLAGQGQALHAIARSRLEPAMGVDLGHITVHTDRRADDLARAVDAEAFTTGSDIYFREGRYDPHSSAGLRLIAHEATHTIQQSSGAVSGVQSFGGVEISEPGDRFEQEADQAAARAMARIDLPRERGNTPIRRLGQSMEPVTARGASMNGPDGATREDEDQGSPVQRLAVERGSPVLQRSVTTDRKPPFVVNFKPFANLQGQPQQPPTTFDRGDPFHDEFNLAPGTSGRLIFLVDMDWARNKGGQGPGPGPNPGPNPGPIPVPNDLVKACDPCPKLPQMLPDPELEGCFKQPDLCARRRFVDDLFRRIADDPCTLISDKAPFFVRILKGLCRVGSFLAKPILAFVSPIIQGVREVVNLIQNNPLCAQLGCAPVTPGGGPGGQPPAPVEDKGTARATLETRYVVGGDRKITLFGPAPRNESNGVAAELVSPVEFSRQEIPGGANLALQPMIKSEVDVNRGGETVKETHNFQHMWDIDLKVPQPPPPQKFCCGTELFPFVTGKDRFEDEPSAQSKLFTWFKFLDKRVKASVFAGQTPVVVAGRASRVGNHAFNLELAEKRAKRVKQMMNNFGGSFAGVDSFAFGELTATGVGQNDPHDRRADVKVSCEVALPAICGPGDEQAVCADPNLPDLGGPVEGESDIKIEE